MINTIPTSGLGRTPRSILMIGGEAISWTSWTIEHNGVFEAGTIHVTVPVPYAKWPWWMQQTEVIVNVFAGFPDDPGKFSTKDLTLLMSARIDSLKLDPATATMTLTGRDLTSLFIDKKTDASFKNLTASEMVQSLADQFSEMKSQIQPTATKVGFYFDADKVQVQKQVSMWTLMTYLAQHEGMQCIVLGDTLYFGNFKSPQFGSALSNEPYAIVFQAPTNDRPYPVSNAEKLNFSHDLTVAGDVTVRVRSYDSAHNKAYSGVAYTDKANLAVEKSAKPTQAKQSYDYIFPGLTDDGCKATAARLLNAVGKHELTMDATATGDLALFPWTPVTVSGTGTLFDTTYQVAKISRSFDSRGFTMTMSCHTAPSPETVKLA